VRVAEHWPGILVCTPDSHPTLYEEVARRELGQALPQVTPRHPTSQGLLLYTYRYAAQLPLGATDDTLQSNWGELTITPEQGQRR